MRASKPCSMVGCANLAPCPAHPSGFAANRARRAERLSSSGADNRRIIRRDRGRCYVCGELGADEVDHVIPLFEGGADTDANKKAIHRRPCHAAKSLAERQRAQRRARAIRLDA